MMRSLLAALSRVPACELMLALVLSFIAMAAAFASAPGVLWRVDHGVVKPLALEMIPKDQSRVPAVPELGSVQIVSLTPPVYEPDMVVEEPWPRVLSAPTKPVEAPSKKPVWLGDVKGLQPHFLERLRKLRAAMPPGQSFYCASGYRSLAVQAALYRQKPGLAAPPGVSNHPKGLACDLKFSSAAAQKFVHTNKGKFGLAFPMSYEPWHIEPMGVTRYAKRKVKRVRAQYVQASGWQ